jgi:protein TonB
VRHAQQFRNCLVDGDPYQLARARRNRIVSLLASIAAQTLLLGLALLLPMLVTAEKLRIISLTPMPPYKTVRAAESQTSDQQQSVRRPPRGQATQPDRPIYQPPRIPPTVAILRDAAPAAQLPPEWIGITSDVTRDGVLPPLAVFDAHRVAPPLPAPPEKKSSRPVRMSEPVQEARLVHRVLPEYPVLAKMARQEGTVVLRAIIGRDGRIREIEVVSGAPQFVKAATDAVAEWRYQPTLLNGEPVEVETLITVVFRLR